MEEAVLRDPHLHADVVLVEVRGAHLPEVEVPHECLGRLERRGEAGPDRTALPHCTHRGGCGRVPLTPKHAGHEARAARPGTRPRRRRRLLGAADRSRLTGPGRAGAVELPRRAARRAWLRASLGGLPPPRPAQSVELAQQAPPSGQRPALWRGLQRPEWRPTRHGLDADADDGPTLFSVSSPARGVGPWRPWRRPWRGGVRWSGVGLGDRRRRAAPVVATARGP